MPTGIPKSGHRVYVAPRADKKPLASCVCQQCKQVFHVKASQLAHRTPKYCSVHCMGLAQRQAGRFVTLNCAVCNKTFDKRRDHLKTKNYCSRICSAIGRSDSNAKWNNADHVRAYQSQYRALNRERLNEKAVARNATKPTFRRARNARYNTKNRHKVKAWAAFRRSQLPGITSDEWLEIKNRYDCRCLACGRTEPEISLTLDHVEPLAKGGLNDASNIQPLCRNCNSRKGTKTIDYRVEVRRN